VKTGEREDLTRNGGDGTWRVLLAGKIYSNINEQLTVVVALRIYEREPDI